MTHYSDACAILDDIIPRRIRIVNENGYVVNEHIANYIVWLHYGINLSFLLRPKMVEYVWSDLRERDDSVMEFVLACQRELRARINDYTQLTNTIAASMCFEPDNGVMDNVIQDQLVHDKKTAMKLLEQNPWLVTLVIIESINIPESLFVGNT